MADNTSGTPESIALQLLSIIKNAEGKTFSLKPKEGFTSADREWILNTYTDCIKAVAGSKFVPQK